MNTSYLVITFAIVVSGLIWITTSNNDTSWTGNRNQCVGDCYTEWKSDNGGGIVALEREKQLALLAASPFALGESYYGQCIACHGSRGQGGIGPQLSGQTASDIVSKLTAYRSGQKRGDQSAIMYPVAKPMSDEDIGNLAAYVSAL